VHALGEGRRREGGEEGDRSRQDGESSKHESSFREGFGLTAAR
jgi:hypothetical protein